MKLGKKIFSAIASNEDPTHPKKAPAPKWDGIVEKKDGTMGKWGNDIKPEVKQPSRLYPTGTMTDDDKEYLKSMKDKKVDEALSRSYKKENQVEQYGTGDSDMFKQLLKKKPVTLPKVMKK